MSKQATIKKGYKKSRVKLSLSTTRRHTEGAPRYVLEDRKYTILTGIQTSDRLAAAQRIPFSRYTERTTCLSHATECTHTDVWTAD